MAVSTRLAWSRSNPINPDYAGIAPRRAAAGAALLAALLLHAGLVWFLLQQNVRVVIRQPVFGVVLVHLPKPVPVPAPKRVVVKPVPQPKTIVKVSPAPLRKIIVRGPARHSVARATPPPPVPKIMHFNAATADTGLGLDFTAPDAGTGQGSMAAFTDTVHQRIESLKTYPPGLAPSHGLVFWNSCVISYRVTVARNGALIRYKLFGCDNPFLDAAARAAILMGAPYPVPPDFGGSQYDVYGSLIFKEKQ